MGCVAWRWLRTAIEKGAGASSCINNNRDGEPMARDTVFWARHRAKGINRIVNQAISARFSLFKELSETLKFIMYPKVTSFGKIKSRLAGN
ncbi:hypothetical protein TNCV_2072461 [Trichonephila clavipes]|nr:hypothetical protein TNCV_2072461 [Trichonephila clavipes]